MLRVGLCGFTMSMEDHPLYFPVVEVQQTFYKPPRELTLRRWVEVSPAGFEFTLKAWQLITHPGTSPTYRRIERTMTAAERAGAGFFQDTPIVQSIAVARSTRAHSIDRRYPSCAAWARWPKAPAAIPPRGSSSTTSREWETPDVS